MSSVIVYGRGFLGYDVGLVEVSDNVTDIKKQIALVRFQKPSGLSKAAGPYNEAVERLFSQLSKGERNLSSFSFRRAILIEAIRAFGTYSFREWCTLQETSYYFTEHHRNFLNDTFNFIQTGERSYGLRPWEYVLRRENATISSNDTKFKYDDYFQSFKDIGREVDFSTLATIQRWVEQPKGFEDLITTLRLVFGKVEK